MLRITLIVLFLAIPASADQADSWDADWVHTYWSQFNKVHTTQVPVTQWLAEKDLSLLWLGEVNGAELRIAWDINTETVLVEVAEEEEYVLLDDVVMVEVPSGRPTWEAAFDEDGAPRLSGMIDVDELNGLIVIGITVDGLSHKMFADDGTGQPAPVVAVSASVCRCFGTGAATKSCSQDECDDPVSCGPSRSCRNCAARPAQPWPNLPTPLGPAGIPEPSDPLTGSVHQEVPTPDTSNSSPQTDGVELIQETIRQR